MKPKVILATLFLGTSVFGLAYAEDEHASAQCAEPPGGLHGCKTTIQAAIDAASPGNTIDVYPGNYTEAASGRTLVALGGAYQFGLFIGQDRSGITIRGVDGKGKRIDDYRKVKALITTNATNNFGPSGIFVEGDGVTISGLGIGVNLSDQNKTIEVIGDDFTLEDCDISDILGSVYINDFRFDTSHNLSHVQSYRIEGNNFQDGVSIDIASGAGFSGRVKDRVIKRNDFVNSYYWPSISFNGIVPGIGWFVYSVGGAVIRDNTFVNTFTSIDSIELRKEGHIRARGTYDNSQFDWGEYFNENKFDKAYATGPKPPKNLREYSYTSSSITFEHVRRIGALLEGELAIAQAGDRTVVKPSSEHD
jgi:hypothetical protein